jgi:hypothetical protein
MKHGGLDPQKTQMRFTAMFRRMEAGKDIIIRGRV